MLSFLTKNSFALLAGFLVFLFSGIILSSFIAARAFAETQYTVSNYDYDGTTLRFDISPAINTNIGYFEVDWYPSIDGVLWDNSGSGGCTGGHCSFTNLIQSQYGVCASSYRSYDKGTVIIQLWDSNGNYLGLSQPLSWNPTYCSTPSTPPSIGTISVSQNPVEINNTTTATASFTDSAGGLSDTASWNWGDGSNSSGTVIESNGSGSVTDNHIYTNAGVYTVTLTVTNPTDGESATQTFQYVSVYNPTSQGLFSAGQHYTSPSGAYIQNPSLTGTVKLGLSYKYQGTMPVSDKQFTMKFNSANLTFNATSITSLITTNGIGTLTGTGTINGSGTYNFLVTGDGNSNTIRIQIKDQLGNVIYDTQPGAADTAEPTTSVTGNVIVHS